MVSRGSGLEFYVYWENKRGSSIPFFHNHSVMLSRGKDVLWICPDRSFYAISDSCLMYLYRNQKDNMVRLFCFMADWVNYVM